MNIFLKENRTAFIALAGCLTIVGVVISFNKEKFSKGLDMQKVGTPMVGLENSLEEKEIINQTNSSIELQNTLPDDDAMSYGDFIKIFGDKRIQFDEACRATPNTSSFSVGDTLMLDNRSNKIQAVRFIDDLYALPPYHVRLFSLERQGVFTIDCGSLRNVAEVIVH